MEAHCVYYHSYPHNTFLDIRSIRKKYGTFVESHSLQPFDKNSLCESQKSPIGWDYHELKKGQDVMITAPKELVQLVEALLDE